MSQYDRALLRAAARDKGDRTPTDLSRRLMVAPATGWRLWNGHTAPSAALVAAVDAAYGVPAAALLRRTPVAA
ncbi:XRE family transcriptional regulator [Streptomyces sp. NBC_01180]|uniref:XRE family transcriptional regulator n=1 Tax=Streptomyces sp. NBC_01180 TaxID=2903763 RepID=UPI00386EA329|nr:XRE family transcriptional regulator [Streptomyces sp. NBC_01180]